LSLVAQHNSISGSLISSRRSHHRDSRRAKEPEHYARECARWAAQTKDEEKQDLFIEMACQGH
jgi:hypothetical protein